MSVQAVVCEAPPSVNPTEMIHLEHPDREREAWCGAPVQGVYTYGSKIECVACRLLLIASRGAAA